MKVQFNKPTEPIRADCGHLCNCFPERHEDGRTAYVWDIQDNEQETGTECGECYRRRMEALPMMSFAQMTAAFRGR